MKSKNEKRIEEVFKREDERERNAPNHYDYVAKQSKRWHPEEDEYALEHLDNEEEKRYVRDKLKNTPLQKRRHEIMRENIPHDASEIRRARTTEKVAGYGRAQKRIDNTRDKLAQAFKRHNKK